MNEVANAARALAFAAFFFFGACQLHNVTYRGNSAAGHGGAVYIGGGAQTILIRDSVFLDNTSGAYGGAIMNAGSLTVRNVTFAGNSATGSGSAIAFLGSVASALVESSSFADGSGAGRYMGTNAGVVIRSSVF